MQVESVINIVSRNQGADSPHHFKGIPPPHSPTILKASLRVIGVEPPKFHDVGPILRNNSSAFPGWFKEEIDRMAYVSRVLRREREPSMYGDEELALSPDDLYSYEDAKKAFEDALFVFKNCKRLMDELKAK